MDHRVRTRQLIWAAVVAGLLLPGRSRAEPYLTVRTGAKCSDCHTNLTGGGKRTAAEMGVYFLGELPLSPDVRVGGDSGCPVALRGEKEAAGEAFFTLARNTAARVREEAGKQTAPKIEITD